MSGAARSVAARHFQGVLNRWPKDPLRPECQLQDVLAKRLEKGALAPAAKGAAQGQADLKQTNALYSLLEDRYKTKYRAATKIFEPESNPAYYNELIKELEEAPNRSFLGRIAKRLSGMIRLT
ncbi:Cytochrome B pre-mRNA-processing protein 6 [Madurella fahalii]|uniref:Cytochrome B pre-mRNA-processing protein 6 n=1 Tax=Madurella fahalii TaxID=1157608 RepID=A0ABQ0GGU9_9PEZI